MTFASGSAPIPAASVTVPTEDARSIELAVFDAASLADVVWYWELAASGWRLAEKADYQADFDRHRGYEPSESRLDFYANAYDAITQLFPPDYPLPDLDWFADGHDTQELIYEGLCGICSHDGNVVRAVIDGDGDTVTTIEAYYDEELGLRPDASLHVFSTAADGSRKELTLLVPERGAEYTQLRWLLEEGAEALAEAADA